MTTLNQQDVQAVPVYDRGWLATYHHVNRIDVHLRWRSFFGIVITGLPPGCAGGGGMFSAHYPGITKEQQ